jgi:hypothetical protein
MGHEIEIQQTITDGQRARLATALGLNTENEIDGAVSAIVETILAHHLWIAAQNRTPNRAKSKRKLEQIALAARKLRLLLSDFDVFHSIGNIIEKEDIYPTQIAKLFHRRPLWSNEEPNIFDMIGLLGNIDINATLMAKDDNSFSFYYMLPTMRETNREFNANLLWPRLFKFWEMAGNKVASTPDGPTFRFLVLVHEIAQIDAPKPDSLRSACERWRTDPMREQPMEIPWGA